MAEQADADCRDPRLHTSPLVRALLVAVAIASLALGIVGLFLPVLPTVPFILLAAWAAARSSPRLSRWLENHPRMGPHIVAWRRGGGVPRRAKWMASVMMAGSSAGMLLVLGPRWFVCAAIATMAAVAAWLWRRPEAVRAG
jgi:uncharacterized membrane protein YbaN (DUF454 family)